MSSGNTWAAQVAVYRDSGVWGVSASHIENLIRQNGHQVLRVDHRQILKGRLGHGDIHALVVPGGKSWEYLDDLGQAGGDQIRRFVDAGGGYLGFCAGAFLALSDRKGGPVTGPYGIGLLRGVAEDPRSLGVPAYQTGQKSIRFNLAEFKEWYRVFFLEGPILKPNELDAASKNLKVIARYADGGIAAVHFEYGQGRVFLSGPHPEVDEKRYWLFRIIFPDPDSEWPIVSRYISYVLGGPEPRLRD